MSSDLVRQALEFVDPEENGKKRRNKRQIDSVRTLRGSDQEVKHFQSKKLKQNKARTKEEVVEENVKKLLTLSQTVTDKQVTKKIVERAVKGRPLLEKIEVKKEDVESIFFPGQSFDDFEDELFCS